MVNTKQTPHAAAILIDLQRSPTCAWLGAAPNRLEAAVSVRVSINGCRGAKSLLRMSDPGVQLIMVETWFEPAGGPAARRFTRSNEPADDVRPGALGHRDDHPHGDVAPSGGALQWIGGSSELRSLAVWRRAGNELEPAPKETARFADDAAADESERTAQARRIRHLERSRALTRGINSAMLRLDDRDALLSEACRVAIADGEFALARVSRLDSSSGRLTVLATCLRCFVPGQPVSEDVVVDECVEPDAGSMWVAREECSLVVNDICGDARWASLADRLPGAG